MASAFAVALVAHLMGLPWTAAFILGAAVAPPDATAVAALGRMLPRRNFMLLKAESLTNDGTALVIYSIAVGAAVGGSYTPLNITGLVLLSYVGGIAAGVLTAGAACLVMRRMRDALLINVSLLLTPFTAFLLAELIGASGVLAVVVAGLIVSFSSARISTAASRRQTEAAWPLGTFLLNGALFVLIGLQIPQLLKEIDPGRIGWLIVMSVVIWVVLIAVRLLFQNAAIGGIRMLEWRSSRRTDFISYRARVVSAFSGFRGAVSLAIALSVPMTTATGEPFPGRDDIIVITAGVIILTLLVQGPLLPAVVMWARFPADTSADDELRLAEQVLHQSAHDALSEVIHAHHLEDVARNRLLRDFIVVPVDVEPHAADPDATTEESRPDDPPATRIDRFVRAGLSLIDIQRDALNRLRREGTIDDTVSRTLQNRLHADEIRLSGDDIHHR